MTNIVVVGSLNMDLVVEVPTIPKPGETVLGDNFATFPGGKGANQAVAAARLGVSVTMIGQIGADSYGESLLLNLASEGVNVDCIFVDEHNPTGVAMISVDASGQNSIAVASGANFTFTKEHIRSAWEKFRICEAGQRKAYSLRGYPCWTTLGYYTGNTFPQRRFTQP